MPKYYCDYCDTYLTHDSPSVRKTHNGGRKHKENVRFYYTKWMEEQAQSLIDQTTAAYQAGSTPAAVPHIPPPGMMPPPPVGMMPPPPGAIPPPGALPFHMPPPGAMPPPGGMRLPPGMPPPGGPPGRMPGPPPGGNQPRPIAGKS
ncbi:hypothetical protein ACROYT_G017012 [Oculina patagonica]